MNTGVGIGCGISQIIAASAGDYSALLSLSPVIMIPSIDDAVAEGWLFQDGAGTIPAAADGDPVMLVRDASGNGNDLTQPTASKSPVLRMAASGHWALEFDGVDDELLMPSMVMPANYGICIATLADAAPTRYGVINSSDSPSSYGYVIFAQSGSTSAPYYGNMAKTPPLIRVDGADLSPVERGELFSMTSGIGAVVECIDIWNDGVATHQLGISKPSYWYKGLVFGVAVQAGMTFENGAVYRGYFSEKM